MNPRGEWQPALLDEYRLHPWQVARYTRRELDALYGYHARKMREAARDGD
jgi:hypothetical protein